MLDLLDLRLIEELEARYRFRDRGRVEAFLHEMPFLAGLLLEAAVEIKGRFGQHAQAALEVVNDPEDGDQKLFAYILTPLAARDVLPRRDRFDEEWWLAASERAKGRLIIDLEFI